MVSIYVKLGNESANVAQSAKRVTQIFQDVRPCGMTPTALRLDHILAPYVKQCEDAHSRNDEPPKKLSLIVITDGMPDENPGPVLGAIGKRMARIDADDGQLGIQFVQVGDDLVSTLESILPPSFLMQYFRS